MFDFDVGKLLLIGVVALIFIPPKDLPAALRQLGRLVGKARRLAADFQSQFNEAIRDTELDDLKNEFRHLKEQASVAGAMGQVADIVEQAGAPAPMPAPVEPSPVEHASAPASSVEGPAGPPLPEPEPLPQNLSEAASAPPRAATETHS